MEIRDWRLEIGDWKHENMVMPFLEIMRNCRHLCFSYGMQVDAASSPHCDTGSAQCHACSPHGNTSPTNRHIHPHFNGDVHAHGNIHRHTHAHRNA
ncbi:MAG: hypothetical protein ABIG63_00105 [Chloroflexota bacterium]